MQYERWQCQKDECNIMADIVSVSFSLTTRIYSEGTISLMIGENMEQVDSRENGFALEVKNFLIGRVYLNIFRCKK